MVGHFWHDLIQYLVLEKLEFCDANAIEREGKRDWSDDSHGPEHPYHWARGFGDIAPLETPTWRGVVDIKTMNSNDFHALDYGLPERFALKYKAQLNIYMDFFDEDQGMILAVNKDSPHDFREIEFQRDQFLIDSIYQKWHAVASCLDHDIVPTPEDDEFYLLVESE